VILSNSKVTLYFSLALESGELVDSNFGVSPATFVMGDGSLLPGFEKRLLGLKTGDKQSFIIPQQDGFGAKNPQNIQTFQRSTFAADLALAEGLIVSFADAAGGELPGVIKSIHEAVVEVDFNHPLAGREITFTVEIVDVQ
jgi:FKBP-type peptidyl-prolyl cis-trans isomerase SlpA